MAGITVKKPILDIDNYLLRVGFILDASLAVLEVVAADAPHPCVVPVALQQGGAVGEEVGMGNAVVLQDDALLHLLEKPADGAAHPEAAALVPIGIEALDLAGPVDLALDHRAGGGHLLSLAEPLGGWAVAGHIQACRRYRADGVGSAGGGYGGGARRSGAGGC